MNCKVIKELLKVLYFTKEWSKDITVLVEHWYNYKIHGKWIIVASSSKNGCLIQQGSGPMITQ